MNVNFRQGIVTYPGSGVLQSFLTYSGGYVTLNAANGNTDVTFAYGDTNYLFTESTTTNNAWGPLPSATDCWLYWDIDTRTGVRTFGFTTVAPVFGAVQPAAPVYGMHWFDTNTQKMYVYTNAFREVIRVFAAKVNTGVFTPLGAGVAGKPYAGTQVGLNTVNSRTGRILIDHAGNPIRKTGGQFFTTEDDIFVDTSVVNVVRLDSTVVSATANETLAKFTVVKFTEFGKISAAEYADVGTTAIAMLTEDLTLGATGTVCVQGLVTNPDWNWPTVGANLWVLSSGQLTDVDPHVANANTFPIGTVPVARVVTPTSVIFDQGLGGKGDKGETGSVAGLGPATTATLGLVALATAPSDGEFPVVVGDNDPRLNNKVLRAGDTMTGPLILSGNPTAALGAATKQYVDALTLNSLADVNTAGASAQNALIYNGTNWVPGTISTEDNVFVIQLRSALGESSHLHYVSISNAQANTLIETTDTSVAVADPSQPFVNITSSANADVGDPDHTHIVTVFYDYVNATFVATSISNNVTDNHVASVVADGIRFDQDLNTFNNVAFNSVDTATVTNSTTISVDIITGQPSTWYQVFGDLPAGTQDDYPSAVKFDSLGNVYVMVGEGINGLATHLVKYSAAGAVLWQRSFADGTQRIAAGSLTVDNNDDVIVVLIEDSGPVTNYFTVIKLTAAGDLAWRVKVNEYDGVGDGRARDLAMATTVDASNNLYITGTISNDVFIIKFTPVGAVEWTKLITAPFGALNNGILDDTGRGIVVDTDGYVYVNANCKRETVGATRNGLLIKLDATGTIVWQREVNYGVEFNAGSLAADGVGGLYTVGIRDNASASLLSKFDRDGNHVWTRQVGGNVAAASVSCDGTHVYVMGSAYFVSRDLYAIKFDLAGNHVWTRQFGQEFNDWNYYAWSENTIDAQNGVYVISGHSYINNASNAEVVTAKLYADGTGTGTFGLFTYADTTLTITTPAAPTVSAGVMSDSPYLSSIHITASTVSVNAGTNTNTTYIMNPGGASWAFNENGSFELPNYTLPAADGTSGQALITDGAGVVTWQTVGGAGSVVQYEPTTSTIYLDGYSLNPLGAPTGLHNVALGDTAMNAVTTGSSNVAIGTQSQYAVTTGNNNVAVGRDSMSALTTGSGNTALGYRAMWATAGASNDNVAIGNQAMLSATAGNGNVAIGTNTLRTANGGNSNVGVGFHSMYGLTTGDDNVGVGTASLEGIASGWQNVAVGSYALVGVTTGANNIGIGYDAGRRISTGGNNVAIGSYALDSVTTVSNMIAIGPFALSANTSGIENIAIGYGAMEYNTTGRTNTAIGEGALNANTTGWYNVAMGDAALSSNTTGSNNVAIGTSALWNNWTASSNVGVGHFVLYNNISGTRNVAMGEAAMYGNNAGVDNVAIGHLALYNASSNYNVAIGTRAMYTVTNGAQNVAIGYDAMRSGNGNWNVVVGAESLYTVNGAVRNSALGFQTLYNTTTGYDNVAIGYQTLYQNTSGNNNIGIGTYALDANLTGIDNVAIGYNALTSLSSNFANEASIAIGSYALQNATNHSNVAIGHRSMQLSTTATQNTAVGIDTLRNITTGYGNSVLGWHALYTNTSGYANVAIGPEALYSNTTGYWNVAIGERAMQFNTFSTNNIAVGFASQRYGAAALAGGDNISFGRQTLQYNLQGYENIAIGKLAMEGNYVEYLANNVSGYHNVAIGSNSMEIFSTAVGNTAVGHQALRDITTGIQNTAIGYLALTNHVSNTSANASTAVGSSALEFSTTAIRNVAVGQNALRYTTTGGSNTAVGWGALASNTTGANNVAVGHNSLALSVTGSFNTAVGESALNATTASNNTAFGFGAVQQTTSGTHIVGVGPFAVYTNSTGNNNIGIGYQSLYGNTTGSNNIAIGDQAGINIATGSNNTIIGNLPGSAALADTVLIAAGTTERIKVDATGLYVNGALLSGGGGGAVDSVNGFTGVVVLTAADVGAAAVSHTHTAANITDFNTAASAAAPVQSVNGFTGAVSLTAANVGAAATSHTHVAADITDFSSAVSSAAPVKLNVAQTFTAPQRGTITTDNDLSFDLNATNNFFCTPTADGALTFTNIASASGQSGFIIVVNTTSYVISAAAGTKITNADLTKLSATGTYVVSYFCNGTNVYAVVSGDLS